MSVTELVFQLLRGWLKFRAFSNLASERATRGASVSERARRAGARRVEVKTHMLCMSTTELVSHALMSLLNSEFLNLESERANDARSERERERDRAGGRTSPTTQAGAVNTHILSILVTELVSQLSMAGLSLDMAFPV